MNRYTVGGGCHCGRVAFEVVMDEEVAVQNCNCSICSMSGFVHLIVAKERFRLLRGQEFLSEYRFNTGVARHLFCAHCGVKSFYVPRSNPDGYSVNLRCLRLPEKVRVIETNFDGQNWEQHSQELHHLSKPKPEV